MKYIVVTGGVLSGIGKGLIASSTGFLLRAYGLKTTAIKIDPYLNIDAGTLSPLDHGEVFVLDDGGEVDLDLGNYERFLDIKLTSDNNITTGKIYFDVIQRERRGDFLGKTVQVVPHITNSIQEWISRVSVIPVDSSGQTPDICIIELGGTVGDIESAPFIEALRQFQFQVSQDDFCLVHASLIPVVGPVGEQKTKPTQACVRDLRALGLYPDIIACRSSQALMPSVVEKISNFCHVQSESVISVYDCESVYHVPILLERQGILNILKKKLKLEVDINAGSELLDIWRKFTHSYELLGDEVHIAIVGKYTHLKDSYISLVKSLEHSSIFCKRKVSIIWIEATDLEVQTKEKDLNKFNESFKALTSAQGVIIPGGFGERGIEGMIFAENWARCNKVPLLGICLGLQTMVIEFSRNVLGLPNAHSEEFDKSTPNPVIIFMPHVSKTHMGGTMKLGAYDVEFNGGKTNSGTKIQNLYKSQTTRERFRHRYVLSPEFNSLLVEKGFLIPSTDSVKGYANIIELKDHPFYVGVQYHPEYRSRPLRPCPAFVGLVMAASSNLTRYLERSS